jgi:enamine deaminase RidA (YjgF/YER057c/UK114 family)
MSDLSKEETTMANTPERPAQAGVVQYLSPDGLPKNPAYSNVIVVTGAVKTVYIGGQNAVDATGAIVGKGDIRAQTEQVMQNIQTALAAGGPASSM